MALYALRAVVEGGWQGADCDIPAAPGRDLADMAGQGAASDDLDGLIAR
jgi:hypothetical protein